MINKPLRISCKDHLITPFNFQNLFGDVRGVVRIASDVYAPLRAHGHGQDESKGSSEYPLKGTTGNSEPSLQPFHFLESFCALVLLSGAVWNFSCPHAKREQFPSPPPCHPRNEQSTSPSQFGQKTDPIQGPRD